MASLTHTYTQCKNLIFGWASHSDAVVLKTHWRRIQYWSLANWRLKSFSRVLITDVRIQKSSVCHLKASTGLALKLDVDWCFTLTLRQNLLFPCLPCAYHNIYIPNYYLKLKLNWWHGIQMITGIFCFWSLEILKIYFITYKFSLCFTFKTLRVLKLITPTQNGFNLIFLAALDKALADFMS